MSRIGQLYSFLLDGSVAQERLPVEAEYVYSNLRWGNVAKTFTPAFWKSQVAMAKRAFGGKNNRFRTSESLIDEVCACLLGGFGIPAEMGYAAFLALKRQGLTRAKFGQTEEDLQHQILEVLLSPIKGDSGMFRYRFPRQKARRLASVLMGMARNDPPENPVEMKRWLMSFPGIGPKTASWIVRNWTGSDEVAIIDIHIFRACTLMGLFTGNESISRDYDVLERKFIELAKAMGERTSDVDIVMWSAMRRLGSYGVEAYKLQKP